MGRASNLLYDFEPSLTMVQLLIGLVPIVFLLAGTAGVWIVMQLVLRSQKLQNRKSPLSRKLRRPPGYSLHMKLEAINGDIATYLVLVVLTPLLVYSSYLSQSLFAGLSENMVRLAASVLGGLAVMAFLGKRLASLLGERKRYKLGLEGEMFTGEELNQLMLRGCRVFHDIVFPYGNIDHVVVSHSGVYSVNSKVRGKPIDADDKASVVVDHRTNRLQFPDQTVPIPVNKLECEANWLSKHLSSAVGKTINVEPILALPGWYMKDRIGRGSVFVINPTDPHKFFIHNRQVYTPQDIRQIAHQLEQLCRDIEPSFRQDRKWEGAD